METKKIKDRINEMLDNLAIKADNFSNKLSNKLQVIHNHGTFVYKQADIKSVKDVQEKFGHKPFELVGIRDHYNSGYNYTSWKETRPIYRLNSKGEISLLGGAVYSVTKSFDEYENHPAVYSFRGFITPSAYREKVEEQNKKETLDKKNSKIIQQEI